ncbi:MAG: hypothetical protein LBI15_02345 [Dysgonamonadaceae bacterium]|jgi:hypothetical protein|nr:hypothetical protein [Dysgonamonadaceae bacterium]
MSTPVIQPCVDKHFTISEAKWEREEQPNNDDFKPAVVANVGERVKIRLWFDKNDIDDEEDNITVTAKIIDAQTNEVLMPINVPLQGDAAVSEPFTIPTEGDWEERDLLVSVVKADNSLLREDYSHEQSTFRVNKPWVRDAYFARKVVDVAENGTSVSFERVRGSILGKTVYLVVETLNMRGENLQVAATNPLSQRPSLLLQIEERRIPSLQGTGTIVIRQPERAENIAQNAQELMYFNGNQYAAERVFATTIGNFAALNNNAGTHNYTNLEADHADKAIIKLQLRPENRAAFDRLARETNENINWQILVQRANTERASFANNHKLSFTGTFLERFLVANRNFYEIYHGDSTYNFLAEHNNERRRIGYVGNNQSEQVVYFYYDQYGNETRIAECARTTVMGRHNGVQVDINNLPAGGQREAAPAGGSAQWNYIYANGNIITTGNHMNGEDDRSFPGQLRAMRYTQTGIYVNLIRMPDVLNINIGNNIVIGYTFSPTQRRFCSPESFAAFVGVLGQYELGDITCTGMCFGDATGYPSVTHVNGNSVDTVYLIPFNSTNMGRRDDQRSLVRAFRDWNFTQIIAGRRYNWLHDLAHSNDAAHNGHLHSGLFNVNTIDNLI